MKVAVTFGVDVSAYATLDNIELPVSIQNGQLVPDSEEAFVAALEELNKQFADETRTPGFSRGEIQDGISSGYYRVQSLWGDTIYLISDSGSECNAVASEISWEKP